MGLLPQTLLSLDARGRPLDGGHFERVDPYSAEGRSLRETDWDEIICASVCALADAFREANVIASDSTLRVLGKQVDGVDVLLMEVSAGGEPRRLVLLEDKLVRNPEARRQVLAQILDYAQRAQQSWTTDFICGQLQAENAAWLRRHTSRVDIMLAQGDLLLVIAGDDIGDDLLRLAKRFAIGANPLSLSEMCLVSLAIYRRNEERLLAPHVVSAVERHQRQLSIRVTVTGPDGAALAAKIERDEEADAEAARPSPLPTNPVAAEFLERARALLSDKLCNVDSYEVTKRSRKVLAYWIDEDARLKIHFGGFVRDAWSPIQVGLYVESTDNREEWAKRVEEATAARQLPEGTKVRRSGTRTVEALKSFNWSEPEELSKSLLEEVVDSLLQFAHVFGPK